MANCSYCQLGKGYKSKLGNKFGKGTGYTGMNSYSNNNYGTGYTSSYNNNIPTVSIPKGVDYTLSHGVTAFDGNQAQTVITKEVIESPTGTITKVTTTQQEPSGYGNSFGRKKREIGLDWNILEHF